MDTILCVVSQIVESDSLHEDVREGRLPQPEARRVETDKEETAASPANSKLLKIQEICDYVLVSCSFDFQRFRRTHP